MFSTQTSPFMSLNGKITYSVQISSSFYTFTSNCLLDIFAWMLPRHLRIIMSKTELVIFTAPSPRLPQTFLFLVDGTSNHIAELARYWGTLLVNSCSLSPHNLSPRPVDFPFKYLLNGSIVPMYASPALFQAWPNKKKLSLLFNGKTLTRTKIMEKEGD